MRWFGHIRGRGDWRPGFFSRARGLTIRPAMVVDVQQWYKLLRRFAVARPRRVIILGRVGARVMARHKGVFNAPTPNSMAPSSSESAGSTS